MSRIKTLLVVKSIHHQNTAQLAASMAENLQADVVEPDDVSSVILEEYDLVGFGSGIYFGMVHPALWRIARRIEPSKSPRVAFIFSTAGLPFLSRLWHWPLKRKLSQKGYQVIGEFSCRGFDTFGPLWLLGGLNRRHPDDADLARGAEFARQLSDSILDSRSHSSRRPRAEPFGENARSEIES